jgi:hypothetical protein
LYGRSLPASPVVTRGVDSEPLAKNQLTGRGTKNAPKASTTETPAAADSKGTSILDLPMQRAAWDPDSVDRIWIRFYATFGY